IVPLMLLVACSGGGKANAGPSTGERDRVDSGEPRAGAAESAEEDQVTQERLNALQEARLSGSFGAAATNITNFSATPGWTGEQLLNANTDDWEPAVATDPVDPYVYILTTRYGQPKQCKTKCPTPYLALTVSSNGGATW